MAFHTPHGSARTGCRGAGRAFDYRTLCEELWAQCGRALRDRQGAKRRHGRHRRAPTAATLSAPLIVDALGWRRVLGLRAGRPAARGADLARPRGPPGRRPRTDLDVWIDRSLVRHGYAWSVPAARPLRVGVGSYEPRHHVKEPTRDIAGRLGVDTVRYQGNWFPHRLRPAVEDGVFFAGDSAGHCLPLSGEGIRTAFYFGIACGARAPGACWRAARRPRRRWSATARSRPPTRARTRSRSACSASIPRLPPRALTALLAFMGRERVCRRAFTWYLDQAHPVAAAPTRTGRSRPAPDFAGRA